MTFCPNIYYMMILEIQFLCYASVQTKNRCYYKKYKKSRFQIWVYNNRTSRSLYLCFHGYSCDIIKVQLQCLDTRDRYNHIQLLNIYCFGCYKSKIKYKNEWMNSILFIHFWFMLFGIMFEAFWTGLVWSWTNKVCR